MSLYRQFILPSLVFGVYCTFVAAQRMSPAIAPILASEQTEPAPASQASTKLEVQSQPNTPTESPSVETESTSSGNVDEFNNTSTSTNDGATESVPSNSPMSPEHTSESRAGAEELIQNTISFQKGGDSLSVEKTLNELTNSNEPQTTDAEAAENLNRIGAKELRKRNYAEAAEIFAAACLKDASSAEYENNAGYAAMLAGDNENANAHLVSALSLDPHRAVAWGNLGELYAQKNDLDSAVACLSLRSSLEGNPRATEKYLSHLARHSKNDVLKEAAGRALNGTQRPFDPFSEGR